MAAEQEERLTALELRLSALVEAGTASQDAQDKNFMRTPPTHPRAPLNSPGFQGGRGSVGASAAWDGGYTS